MKKTMKKNNKGFSLVELIVVVLIMAIIGVALAPQVMKWVGNSRVAADVQSYDSVVSTVQLALADSAAYTENKAITASDKVVITITTNAAPAFSGGTSTALQTAITNVGDITKVRAKVAGASYKIEVYGGKVYQTTAPDGSTVQ